MTSIGKDNSTDQNNSFDINTILPLMMMNSKDGEEDSSMKMIMMMMKNLK